MKTAKAIPLASLLALTLVLMAAPTLSASPPIPASFPVHVVNFVTGHSTPSVARLVPGSVQPSALGGYLGVYNVPGFNGTLQPTFYNGAQALLPSTVIDPISVCQHNQIAYYSGPTSYAWGWIMGFNSSEVQFFDFSTFTAAVPSPSTPSC